MRSSLEASAFLDMSSIRSTGGLTRVRCGNENGKIRGISLKTENKRIVPKRSGYLL